MVLDFPTLITAVASSLGLQYDELYSFSARRSEELYCPCDLPWCAERPAAGSTASGANLVRVLTVFITPRANQRTCRHDPSSDDTRVKIVVVWKGARCYALVEAGVNLQNSLRAIAVRFKNLVNVLESR